MKKLCLIVFLLFAQATFAKFFSFNPIHYILKAKNGKAFLINSKTKKKKTFHLKLDKFVKMPKATKNKTKYGAKRDKVYFWKKYKQKYPHEFSAKNLMRIKQGKSPIVDKKWLHYHRDYKAFKGQILEHHHLNHGNIAVPLPSKLHRGKGNYNFWHNKSK